MVAVVRSFQTIAKQNHLYELQNVTHAFFHVFIIFGNTQMRSKPSLFCTKYTDSLIDKKAKKNKFLNYIIL